MKIERIPLLALLLLAILTVAGCGLFHHCGPRHCKADCEFAARQPCPQPGNCDKGISNKPCCEKMKTAETPAQ